MNVALITILLSTILPSKPHVVGVYTFKGEKENENHYIIIDYGNEKGIYKVFILGRSAGMGKSYYTLLQRRAI